MAGKRCLTQKDIQDTYEAGKGRRYGLLFAVNGGALAIVDLMVGATTEEVAQMGWLTPDVIAVAMIIFTGFMGRDIHEFGDKMKGFDEALVGTDKNVSLNLFGPHGRRLLWIICSLIVIAWALTIVPRGMAEPQIIHTLDAKRREIETYISATEKPLAQARADLAQSTPQSVSFKPSGTKPLSSLST
jgi:hypothetical protein